jgi:deoxyxylulose-5-phosphate synthase
MLHRANEAVKNLSALSIKPTLIDVFIFKPLSQKLIEIIKDYQNIITIEEQCLDGGFGSIIIESLSDIGFKNNIKRIGLPNKYFFENGGRDYLLDNNGLSVLNIENEIKKFNN